MSAALTAGADTAVRVFGLEGATTAAVGRLRVGDDGVARLDAAAPADSGDGREPELCISPGWADLHAHVFDGSTQISVAPDRVGLDQGVHLLADAGSAGEATVRGLAEYVIPTARTEVVAWLNIGSHGLVHLREVASARFIDVDRTIEAVRSMPELIRGIKVRSSGAIVGDMGLQPLQLGRLVARECGIPLLVHVGEAPPLIDDVLDLLDEGDSITHCFHGKSGYPWRPDGRPAPALARAIERGVRLDVGHGAASFDINVARRAIEAGYLPDTISTDIHVRNIDGPVFDLANVMTKLLFCGMPLPAVLDAVTTAPRRTLRMERPWLAGDGTVTHATLFRVSDESPSGRVYTDSMGNPVSPEQHIVPVATITAGRVSALA